MTTLTITAGRKRGDFVLHDADGRSRGSLRAGWTLRRARIQTEEGSWTVQRRGWQQVDVVAGDRLVVSLGPDQVTVPGPGPQTRWSTDRDQGCWRGSLRRGAADIEVRLTAPGARSGQVDVTGEWEQVDLVVLAACFGVVLQHRRRVVIASGGA